jgi:hypothetical protein
MGMTLLTTAGVAIRSRRSISAHGSGKLFMGTVRDADRSPIMKLSSFAVVVLASCSDAHNPPTLWLALDGAEIHVTLIDHDPPPY